MISLEILEKRVAEIESAIVNATNNVYTLHGHKAEALFLLAEAKKAVEGAASAKVGSKRKSKDEEVVANTIE
jgi:hypothetical protein